MDRYPKVTIEYCAKCKWQNRAIWYVQEILQTFDKPGVNLVADVSVQPRYDAAGHFRIVVSDSPASQHIIYQRKLKHQRGDEEPYLYEGFPDSKFVKTLIRDRLFPDNGLGHVDRGTNRAVLNRGAPAECVACNE